MFDSRSRRLVALAVLFAIAAAEATLRLRYREQLKIGHYPAIYAPDNELGYRYLPNTRSRLSCPGIERDVVINELGFCGRVFPMARSTEALRIAVVVTSDGTGIWLDRGPPFPERLQRLFDKRGIPAEILNFSIDGRNRGLESLRLIEQEVVRYAPDLVLLALPLPLLEVVTFREMHRGYVYEYGNSGDSPEELERSRRRLHKRIAEIEGSWVKPLYDLSYTVRAAFRAYLRRAPTSRLARSMDVYRTKRLKSPLSARASTLEDSIARVQATESLLKDEGGRLFLLDLRGFSSELYAEHGLSHISLDLGGNPQLMHELDGHFNDRGHKRIANLLFQRLTSKRRSPQAPAGAGSRAPSGERPERPAGHDARGPQQGDS